MQSHTAQTLNELYRQCQGELEGMLYKRVRCQETAADLCQEAFKQVCQVDDLSKVNNLKGYLYRTAMNLLCDHIRKKSVWADTIVEWPEDSGQDGTDTRSAEWVTLKEEQLQLFVDALSELPPLCQRVFYLSRFEGLKQREIADQLNISVRSVEHNLKRALLHCAKALEKN